jgi:phospholipase D1/2
VLIDGGAYFGALRKAMVAARSSIFIVGWDVDSRTPLVGEGGMVDDGLPTRLGDFLSALVERRPELQVNVLLWDYSMVYALEREPLPHLNLQWATPPQISVCLDDALPAGASHHQKIVVVDDAVAFSGGLDLTIRRWDTPAHQIDDARRVDPQGQSYRPFHDIQMCVDGAAASALSEIVRERWGRATCEESGPPGPRGDRWPNGLVPDFRNVEVGIARTRPQFDGEPAVHEVEALFLRSIAAAEKSIYIENQFLTVPTVADALIDRLKAAPELQVLIVSPNVHQSWLEERSMNTGRRRFLERLAQAGVADRVRLRFPYIPGDDTGEGVMVHAKLMIVDDNFLRIGSANLNNRSMGMDSECDLAIEAKGGDDRRVIAAIRNRLLGEHLGVDERDVAQAFKREAGLFQAVDSLSGGARGLAEIDLSRAPVDELATAVGQLADPERPARLPDFMGDAFGGIAANGGIGRILKASAVLLAVIGVVALWRQTPLAELADPRAAMEWLRRIGGEFWMPSVMVAAFVAGSLFFFPVTVLIVISGMMFAPSTAISCALVGAGAGASLTFWIGHSLGKPILRNVFGARVNRISQGLARRGVAGVAALRMLPLAPFAVVNLAMGASHIRFVDFLLGTVAGMAPGIVVSVILGRQLGQVAEDASAMNVGVLILLGAMWIPIILALQWAASFLRRKLRR